MLTPAKYLKPVDTSQPAHVVKGGGTVEGEEYCRAKRTTVDMSYRILIEWWLINDSSNGFHPIMHKD